MEQLILTNGQQRVFDHIIQFLNDDSKKIFILKGYAGTGKTTLITYLGNYLHTNRRQFQVLAPTGRAAKVIQQKFSDAVQRFGFTHEMEGVGSTIHRQIYSKKVECLEVKATEVSEKSYKFFFPLRDKQEPENMCDTFIIDESSMIGDTKVDQEFLMFGSGRLLTDLLEYARVCHIKKLIFVGDDAQLPPVEDPESRALKVSYFENLGLGVEQDELTEVLRQNEDSGILDVATQMRELLHLQKNQRNSFSIEANNTDIFEVPASEIAQKYTDLVPNPEVGDNILLSFSNHQCYMGNQAIREIYFPNCERITFEGESIIKVQIGDILLNTKNAHAILGSTDIYNGDMVRVLKVGESVSHTAPVFLKGDQKAHYVTLNFTFIEALLEGTVIKGYILDNYLYAKERNIKVDEERALYTDFVQRMKLEFPLIKEGSDEWKEALLEDPFFNALRMKFGYAITCHKSQGGEWKQVMVDYSGRAGLSEPMIRWCYTATTRARKRLYIINAPHITPFSGLKFYPIGKIGRAPKHFFNDDLRLDVPEIGSAHWGFGLKYKGIVDAINGSAYTLSHFINQSYKQIFDFAWGQEIIHIEFYIDGEGCMKTRLPLSNDGSHKDELSTIINDSLAIEKTIDYKASNKVREELYQRMISVCEEVGVAITNIIEDPSGYAVLYHLKTDALYATIKFTNGADNALGVAMPQSELAENDEKLKYIIENL